METYCRREEDRKRVTHTFRDKREERKETDPARN